MSSVPDALGAAAFTTASREARPPVPLGVGAALTPADREVEIALDRALAEQGAGRLKAAAQWFETALRAKPDHVRALSRYSLLALSAGNTRAALELGQRAVAAEERDPEAQHFLGLALRQAGRLADAVERVRHAVELDPGYVDAQVNLGNLLLETGDAAAARVRYEAALALKPDSSAAQNNLGNAYRELRLPDDALTAYRRAIMLDPNHVDGHNNVGNMLKDMGDADGAVSAFRHALAGAPNRADVWSNMLLSMNGSDTMSAMDVAIEHRRYGEHFAALIPRLAPVPARKPGARLRIGYVSSDFRRHAVATFFLPLLDTHDRTRFEIHCYYNQLRGDELTQRIRDSADGFVPIAGLRDRELAERVRHDGIDILVDLNGHTADNRLTAFFLHAAPVQATWLGYLSSTGIAAIDWRITDVNLDPPGRTEVFHAETLCRLPETLWCYAPYDAAPDVTPLPSSSGAPLTFICLNNPGKVSPTVLGLWADVLAVVPDSRLIVQTSTHAPRVAEIARHFAGRGIDPGRIEQLARRPLAAYLALYGRADLALDTWPYTGGTTTCDALWMGVPVVTLASDRPFARSGASVLRNAGVPELVASSPLEYVAIACDWARDREGLAAMRAGLRDRMRASRLMDAPAFARDLEAAYESMWARYGSGRKV